MSITRNGKIGRLPKYIRDQLNRRLENGELGIKIVKWLNGLPDVQEILKEQFGGQPINETNLTAWRQGGHQDWLRHQESCEKLRSMLERAEDLDDTADGMEISDRLGSILAAELAAHVVKLLEEVTDPRERWRQIQEVLRALRHLRHEDHHSQRIQLQRERWDREVERQNEEDLEHMKEEHKNRLTAMRFSALHHQANAKAFGGGERGEKIAELLHRITFDLPLEDLFDDTALSGKTSPDAIKPDQGKLRSIKPDQAGFHNGHTPSDKKGAST